MHFFGGGRTIFCFLKTVTETRITAEIPMRETSKGPLNSKGVLGQEIALVIWMLVLFYV